MLCEAQFRALGRHSEEDGWTRMLVKLHSMGASDRHMGGHTSTTASVPGGTESYREKQSRRGGTRQQGGGGSGLWKRPGKTLREGALFKGLNRVFQRSEIRLLCYPTKLKSKDKTKQKFYEIEVFRLT